jgi:hypothetical protein
MERLLGGIDNAEPAHACSLKLQELDIQLAAGVELLSR